MPQADFVRLRKRYKAQSSANLVLEKQCKALQELCAKQRLDVDSLRDAASQSGQLLLSVTCACLAPCPRNKRRKEKPMPFGVNQGNLMGIPGSPLALGNTQGGGGGGGVSLDRGQGSRLTNVARHKKARSCF